MNVIVDNAIMVWEHSKFTGAVLSYKRITQ